MGERVAPVWRSDRWQRSCTSGDDRPSAGLSPKSGGLRTPADDPDALYVRCHQVCGVGRPAGGEEARRCQHVQQLPDVAGQKDDEHTAGRPAVL